MIETLVENGAEEGWGKTTECKVKEVKRYFKTDFKAHMSREEHCADQPSLSVTQRTLNSKANASINMMSNANDANPSKKF